ncbi:hypothetical protein [Halopelagius longus]|uniref:Uncharacterized protein n=1 Tax=Halopelagius longus TaxID=1236180 RepID=A0A1H0Z087_9EURY|nr:hypothetical protein [Halopelagius longus]SDQ20768.1 hypothetical protein SAMN05216278_0937 [Halopelagius longus]
MVRRRVPEWLYEVNEKYVHRLVGITIVVAVLFRLAQRPITELVLEIGTASPFGLLPRYLWVVLFVAISAVALMRYYGFGLLNCVGVSFVVVVVYLVPLSRPMGFAGPMAELVVLSIAFAAVAACIVGTGGFVVGTVVRRLRSGAAGSEAG